MHERLGGRLRIRQRAMTGLGGRAEEVGERGEADALRPAFEQPPREPDGVDDRGRDAPAREPLDLDVEEPEVEARVVRDEDGVAGEVEEPADDLLGRGAPRSARGSIPVSAAIASGSGARGSTRDS